MNGLAHIHINEIAVCLIFKVHLILKHSSCTHQPDHSLHVIFFNLWSFITLKHASSVHTKNEKNPCKEVVQEGVSALRDLKLFRGMCLKETSNEA